MGHPGLGRMLYLTTQANLTYKYVGLYIYICILNLGGGFKHFAFYIPIWGRFPI